MNTAFDYEAQRREREAKEQRDAATLRLKVRGVARALGGQFVHESEGFQHTIELAPTVQLWARRDWRKKDMIVWGARCPRVVNVSVPTISTAQTRSVAATAADVARRLVPAAHAACRTAIAEAGRQSDLEHARWARVEELVQVLGPMNRTQDKTHYVDGFTIRHDELLGGYDARIRAEVRVRSWHCLLMIARLVDEDNRVAGHQTHDDR